MIRWIDGWINRWMWGWVDGGVDCMSCVYIDDVNDKHGALGM